MKLSTIVIGDEILLGQVTDTNSGAIARTFGPRGWTVCGVRTVADSAADIRRAVDDALADADMVITTGGLGPTKDDITKSVLTDIFGGTLVHDPAVAENIRRVFSLRGLKLNALTEGQAMVPSSCKVVQNLYGTAPVMWFERGGKVLVSMPGVPFETEGMLPEVARLVALHFTPDTHLYHHSLLASGITESALAERLAQFESQLPAGTHLAYLPSPGIIRLRLDGAADAADSGFERLFASCAERLESELGPYLLYRGDAPAAAILLDLLKSRGLTVATAESCTGGTIASRITAVPGSSEAFLGGVVSYANEVKTGLLDVGKDTLACRGAVSREVVEQMAAGACRATGARCAMATSGIAGPGGATEDKPVGTVWIGWCVDGRVSSRLFHFPGKRDRVIDRAATEAILGLIHLLKNE